MSFSLTRPERVRICPSGSFVCFCRRSASLSVEEILPELLPPSALAHTLSRID